MPTGSFRFRQNKRFVNSTFRGARRDTFPYIPYPTEGRVLDLSSFTFESAEVSDISGENNNAALYSGRGVNLSGSNYVELPDVGTTKSITVLARSSTDTTLYATDDATQTEDATAALVADGTWQEVTLTFASAITGEIRLGSDGASFFAGDLSNARCRDASDDLLDQFYLNEHTDTAASGLDGLPCIGLEGNIGQYVGCAAVIQVPGDVGGLTPPQVLGMDFNRYSAITPTPVLDPDGDILVPKALTGSNDALGNAIQNLRTNKTFNADSSGYALVPDSNSLDLTTEATWVFDGNFYDAVSATMGILAKDNLVNGSRSWNFTKSPADTAGRLRINFASSAGSFAGSVSFPVPDADSVIVARFDNGALAVFVDGSEVTTTVEAGSIPSLIYVSSTNLTIGCYGDFSGNSSFPISSPRIYNRALTEEEIQSL